MRIVVKRMTGESKEYDFNPFHTITDIKKQVAAANNIDSRLVKLILNGVEIKMGF